MVICCALGLGICIVKAEEKPEPQMPVLSDIGQFYSLKEKNSQQRCRYSWDLDINYYDRNWRLLWVENNGNPEFISLGDDPLPIHAGQRVRFEGEVLPTADLSLKGARLSILPGERQIQALDTKGALADSVRFHNHLVSLEASVVSQSEPDSTHLRLEASAEGHRVVINIQIDPKEPRPQLEGALVSATGVYADEKDSSGRLMSITLWVSRLEMLKLLNPLASAPGIAQSGISTKEPLKQTNNATPTAAATATSPDEGQPAILKDIGQYYIALSNSPTQRFRYSWDLNVHFYDWNWRLLWVENNGKVDFLNPGDAPLPIKAGQRVRFEGEIVPAEGQPLRGARLTILPEGPNIQPLDTKGAIADAARFNNRLVTIEAIVDKQSEPDSTHFLLEARTEEHRVVIRILIDPKAPRPQLEGTLISATGVYASECDTSGRPTSISLWVPGLEMLKLVKSQSSAPGVIQPGITVKEVSKQSKGLAENNHLSLLTDIGRFYVALSNDPAQRYRYVWDLDVYYYDPDWKLMWVENNGKADFISPGDDPLPVQSGQRARFEGEIVPAEGLSLKGARLHILPSKTEIQPLDTKGAIADNARFHNRLVSIEALVDKQSDSDATHLLLEASAEEHHVVMHILIGAKAPRPQLEGAVVSVEGVYAGVTNFTGKLTSVSLWVPSLEKLKIVNWLSKDPRFLQPSIAIEEIPNQPAGKVVKVVGTVHSIDSTESSLTLRDFTGQVVVSTAQMSEISPGAELEAIGTCETKGVQWRLRNAIVRQRQKSNAPMGNQSSEVKGKLRLADQVLALKPDEVNKGIPVQLFGVATWADPAGRSFFVQDVSRGVEVLVPDKLPFNPQVPRTVSVKGVSMQGPFAPVVVASDILWNDPLGAPESKAVTLEQLMMGGEHGRWIEIQGYLRSVTKTSEYTRLDLTASTGEFTAELPPDADVSGMQGAIISVRGVCSVIPNDRRQLVAVKLLVPSCTFVRVVEAPQIDPFAAEESSIARLREFTPAQSFLRRVRTSGTVLLHSPGKFIAIQDAGEALLVLCRDRVKFNPGDYIEAVGIPGREGARVVLRETICRLSRSGKEPTPFDLSSPQLLGDSVDGHLVKLRGKIVGVQKRAYETAFTLQADDRLFEATLASDRDHDASAMIGSQVALTGVYRTKYDEYRQPIDFTILLRSANDINVLQAPPLWTTGRALSVVVLLLVVVLGGVSWVVVLRQRVNRQTDLIRRQYEREARLEAELQKAARIESVGLLAGGIAHDFNNLLTVILGNLSLALSEAKVVELVGEILKDASLGALRARDLTQKLLTFSKGGDPFRTAIRLPELVRETISFASHGSNVRCDFSIPPDLWHVEADRTQIGQVVQNLTINAIQAMQNGGVMRTELANCEVSPETVGNLAAGKYVRLRISDTGPGIKQEVLPRVFDPYFTTKVQGNGLGLATAYSIVKKHLGHIEVESALGKGSTFTVWLPVSNKPASEKAAPEATKVVPSNARSMSARVLVMDDEDSIRILCSKALSRLGLEVTTTAEGAEAVQEFSLAWESGRPYQLVIFDLTVPGGMGGKDAMAEVHKIDPRVLAIVSSGYSNDPVLADYKKYGFNAVVPKPYEIAQLIDVVKQLLARKN